MILKPGMIVIPPKGCSDYLTPGKEYEVIRVLNFPDEKTICGFFIRADIGAELFSNLVSSAHLNGLDWIIKQ